MHYFALLMNFYYVKLTCFDNFPLYLIYLCYVTREIVITEPLIDCFDQLHVKLAN